MKIILFGATGMVGQGVLRECLLDPGVERVLAVVRSPTEKQHQKLRELVVRDFLDLSPVESELAGYDACFFCLGVSSAGMTFVFVSGAGSDSTEAGRLMWARIKGKAENAVLRMPFKASYVFRPAYIQPRHGIRSRTRMYRVLYLAVAPLYPLLKAFSPRHVTTTEQMGRAMIAVARKGASKRLLENWDINEVG